MNSDFHRDLARTVFAVLFIAILMTASFWILRPFLSALIWSITIVVSTWPIMMSIQRRLWDKRYLAVTVMIAAILMVFVAPLSAAIETIATNADKILGWVSSVSTMTVPPPPEFIAKVPFIGEKIATQWHEYSDKGLEDFVQSVTPYTKQIMHWFTSKVGSFGLLSINFLLIVIMSTILYASGEKSARWARRFGRRLAGDRGDAAIQLAGQAIRGVALGVVVTALVQSLLGGIGLAVAGVPFVAVLTAMMFILSLAQITPVLVLIGALAWLWWNDSTGWFIALFVWSVIVGSLDNILRPILIRKGADLPLLLIFAGVIGGLLAFGLMGLFIGPVILAVSYTLLDAWVAEAPDEQHPQQQQEPPAAV